ncbi:biotin/lipoyl-containing protein, partial [Parvibaculum sp.]|uniref:biotin/lipoyl-containing protein n=1 Tax=Parvibaculum sp. TaxID=2024848 RepID=UPI0034A01DF8
KGHAVEVRLYAEDPAKKFFPSTGRLSRLRAPADMPHVRMDMGVREGDEVTMFYDPMIGKIIAHGETRRIALRTLKSFLAGMEVAGPKTNLGFLIETLGHDAFIDGDIDTGFIDRHLDALLPPSEPSPRILALAAAAYLKARERTAGADPWSATDQWVLGGRRAETIDLVVGGSSHRVKIEPDIADPGLIRVNDGASTVSNAAMTADGTLSATVDGTRLAAAFVANGSGFTLIHEGIATEFTVVNPLDVDVASDADTGALKAPMPGKIVQVMAETGATIKRGAALVVMEAMKMEQTLLAAADGKVAAVNVAVGDQIEAGAVLVAFEEAEK